MDEWKLQEAKTPEEMERQRKQGRSVMVGLLVFISVVTFALVGLNLIFAPYQVAKPTDTIDTAAVKIACRGEAQSRLKYPETAEFPNFLEEASTPIALVNGGAVMKSWIKGKNAFGVVQKFNFICNVNPDGRGKVNLGMLPQ